MRLGFADPYRGWWELLWLRDVLMAAWLLHGSLVAPWLGNGGWQDSAPRC